MERREFIRTCCYAAIGISIAATALQSCGAIYYATVTSIENRLLVKKSEFLQVKKDKTIHRKFVLIKTANMNFPICLYHLGEDNYSAALMKCTHRGCELNVGGGIYNCPCHGSEFSITGKVLEGPADKDLLTFKTQADNENIYIYIS
jgi:cytochrome b6-f complex iron-sulfur subunit